MHEVYEFLKEVGIYYLATVENGEPRVRPFGTIDLYDGKLTFLTGASKSIAAQLNAEPRIQISAVGADGKWIRLTADAARLNDTAAEEHMLEAYPDLKAAYTAGDPNTAVYALANGTADIIAGADVKTYTF